MSKCPFLSTNNNDILCFDKCALQNLKENGNSCPFKNISADVITSASASAGASLNNKDINN